MKKNFSILSIGIATVIMISSCGPTSHVEVAKGVSFSNYKTFGWANDTASRADNSIVDNNIKNAVSSELVEKGWTQSSLNPDVVLDYNVTVQKGVRQETQPVYSYAGGYSSYPYTGYFHGRWRRRYGVGYYYNPAFFSGYTTYNVPFKEGTLTVNMADARTNKLLWSGYATGDITSKYVTSQQANTDVESIFKKLHMPNL